MSGARALAVVASASALAGAFAACGGDDSTSTASSSTTSTASSSTTSTATVEDTGETTEFLGATLTAATAGEPGVVVVAVAPGSKSRLQEGDVIVEAEGKPVSSPEELLDAVGKPELGGQFTIKVARGDKRITLTEVQSPTAFLGTQVQDAKGGALVVGLAPDSPAADAGIEKGDLIVAVDGDPVGGGDDLLRAVGTHSPGDEVTIAVERDGERVEVKATLIENPGATGG
jgi:S1-C subfamily serine protease